MARIGFIGLGNMGTPMAANLVKNGHTVQGFDLLPDNIAKAEARGVGAAPSASDAAKGVDAVITMLPAGKDTLAVWGGGVLQAATPGTLFIDSSTIDVSSARTAHQLAVEARMASLDAPVSGGVGGAEAATLTFMCGGATEAFERARPILEAMGKRVVHCGEAGAGQAAKICNNMMLGVSMIGVCEAFVLAEKLGLSHQALFEVASTSSGQCWARRGSPRP
jgi:3-hydroxyisobutyrate dehydrogenase